MENFKILFNNIGYARPMNGSKSGYIVHFPNYFYTRKRTANKALIKLENFLKREDPDLFCVTEIEPRFKKRLEQILPYCDVSLKYDKDYFLSKAPIFRVKSNGFFSKHPLKFRKHYFNKGVKKLVYKILLPGNIHLFLLHLSITKKARAKQLQELAELISNEEKIIVCGDFNTFAGEEELEYLLSALSLKLINSSTKTYPSKKPKFNLDLFLCSDSVKVKKFKVINELYSDHLPILLEIKV